MNQELAKPIIKLVECEHKSTQEHMVAIPSIDDVEYFATCNDCGMTLI